MKFYFKENINYILGYKNAAIYDNIHNKVYSINEDGKKIIEKALLGKRLENKIEKDYISELEKMDLITHKKLNDTIVIKKPKPKLIYAWLEITEKCNLKCVHCYGQFGEPKIEKEKLLTTEEWKEIIKKLAQNDCKGIQLIGGEPTLHKEFYEILKFAYEQGIERIDVFTNATLIDENSITLLKKTNAKIRVSIYGHNAEIHEKITNQKGSFEKTKNALRLLKENNIPTTVAVIIMKENEKYIESLGHIYSGYDVIRQSCVNDSREHSITQYETLKSRYSTKPEFYTNKTTFLMNQFYNSCWNGKIAITSTGNILPCIFARNQILGNIKTNALAELKNEIIKSWEITKDDIEICKDCEFRYCCHDCRPLAEAINGNVKSKYPRCCYNPYKGEWEDITIVSKEIKRSK